MNQALTITYQPAPATASLEPWLRLEQITPGLMEKYASLADLHDLWLTAAGGRSARLVRPATCPVEFDGDRIHVYLGFYAWPSAPTLPFTLAPAIGTISAIVRGTKVREFSLLVDNSDQLEFAYYLEDVEISWETPCFAEDGSEIDPPSFVIEHGLTLRLARPVFGVVRVKATATGFHCTAKMTLSKPVEETAYVEPDLGDDTIMIGAVPATALTSWKIENLENTITATWLNLAGETETEQLRLEIPPCVKALLAMCPDMYQTLVLLCSTVYTKQVFWNPCTGNVVFVREAPNPTRFCEQIAADGGVVMANPWGIGSFGPKVFDDNAGAPW